MCQRVSSDPGDVHSALSSTAQPRSSGLMPVAFMQPVPLLLVFLFSCCLLIMCPKWDSFHLSLLRPAVFQASFALGPPDLSFWWSRVSIELSSNIIFPMKPFFFATSFHCPDFCCLSSLSLSVISPMRRIMKREKYVNLMNERKKLISQKLL